MALHQAREKVIHFMGLDQFYPYEEAPEVFHSEPFFEREPSVAEFFQQYTPSFHDVGRYILRLFPFIDWIGKYNWTWFLGDLIAGVTVGAVVVPQGMAYAQLALLPVQFGLYSSFMGVLIYWFFATSKDITIGPVGVMSLVTGRIVARTQGTLDIPPHFIASALAVVTGGIITALGLARLGWIVDFIPLPAICAFMTGGAITVLSSQLNKIMGISNIDTHQPPYLVIIDTLKGLPTTKIDAALGLTALIMLYSIRSACAYGAKTQPHRAKMFFFISTLRTVFVILLYTAISAGVNLHRRQDPLFSILQNVPRGFQAVGAPRLNAAIVKTFVKELPAAVIVMLIEHISISKSFGRINNYTIDPSQELVAIGVTNLLGPFLGAYPATGSFSRTTIKSKCGVRTPLAGLITAIVVLLALYALTAVFFYIPDAALGAVIFHAVGDVITPPRVVWQMWRISPLEVLIYLAGVFVTVFNSIENGIYTTICVSFAVVIWRVFLSEGHVLGLARIRTVKTTSSGSGIASDVDSTDIARKTDVANDSPAEHVSFRTGFFPINHADGTNPKVGVEQPHPGVFIYRPSEGFNYPNANRYLNDLTEYIFQHTRRTDPQLLGSLGDRPWNDGLPRNASLATTDNRPILKAIILDFSTVNNMDVTAAQALMDVRNQLARYAAPDTVEWRFANIQSRWTKRALASAGFGYRSPDTPVTGQITSIFSIADLGDPGCEDAGVKVGPQMDEKVVSEDDLEIGEVNPVERGKGDLSKRPPGGGARSVAVHGLNRPYFHVDLQEALEATIANVH